MKIYAVLSWFDLSVHEFDVSDADEVDVGVYLVEYNNVPRTITLPMWADSPTGLAEKMHDNLLLVRDDIRRQYDRTGDLLLSIEFGTVPIETNELDTTMYLPAFSRRPKS